MRTDDLMEAALEWSSVQPAALLGAGGPSPATILSSRLRGLQELAAGLAEEDSTAANRTAGQIYNAVRASYTQCTAAGADGESMVRLCLAVANRFVRWADRAQLAGVAEEVILERYVAHLTDIGLNARGEAVHAWAAQSILAVAGRRRAERTTGLLIVAMDWALRRPGHEPCPTESSVGLEAAQRERRTLALRFVEWSAAAGLHDFLEAPSDCLQRYRAELTRTGLSAKTRRLHLWAAREILASAGRARA